MQNRLLFFLLLLTVKCTFGQQPLKKIFNAADSVYGYYTIIEPENKKATTLLVLLDGYGGNADNFLVETKIDEAAFKENILTVCVPTGLRLYADTGMVNLLNRMIRQTLSDYHIPKTRLVMGGFSSGGTIVLRYAEWCSAHPAESAAEPAMLFTGDSPVDLAGLYRSSKVELQKNFKGWWLGEAQMIIDTLGKAAGDPLKNKKAWQNINPFNAADTAVGNEKYLMGMAYRTYHDVDVQWQMENRGRSLYQTNALDASELVSRLRMRGNNRAAFVQSKVPGQRSNGTRHPHSWNIIDAEDLMRWISEELK